MDSLLSVISNTIRGWMLVPARAINRVSDGRVTPNHITLVSLLGHGLIVWALWNARPIVAAFLLIFFGLMDSLDGALARVQKSSSVNGMLYDATSDRVKEVLMYVGLTQYVLIQGSANYTWLPAAVLGGSLVVSYIKAKGEMALATQGGHDAQKLNRVFSDGVARYEVRMALIVLALLSGRVVFVLWVLLILVTYTALQRIIKVSRALSHV